MGRTEPEARDARPASIVRIEDGFDYKDQVRPVNKTEEQVWQLFRCKKSSIFMILAVVVLAVSVAGVVGGLCGTGKCGGTSTDTTETPRPTHAPAVEPPIASISNSPISLSLSYWKTSK